MKKSIENLKINISDRLELPIEIVMDLPKITIIGNMEVNIANHKGIIEYSIDLIRINTKVGVVKITGQKMEIKNIFAEEISIVGSIEKIEIIS